MKQRLDIIQAEPSIYEVMMKAEKLIAGFDLDKKLVELVKIRASQINGCGFCLNMHTRDARKLGESEQRLYTLAAWWETPFFTEEEQVALKLTEEVTKISEGGVRDETYQKAVSIFGEKKFSRLLFVILTINSWNRLAVAAHKMPE